MMLNWRKNDVKMMPKRMLKQPETFNQMINQEKHVLLRRPFRTYKMMKPLPVAEATGYTTVPLQGTGQQLNQKPRRGVDRESGQDSNKNSAMGGNAIVSFQGTLPKRSDDLWEAH